MGGKSHGFFGTRFYTIWAGMKSRCYQNTHHKYHVYGARGIAVCQQWHDFSGFHTDMYESYCNACRKYGEKSVQIDRVNVEGDYSPTNCRWVTPLQNSRNRRKHRLLLFQGKEKPLSEWADVLGFAAHVLHNRIDKYGWSIDRALSTPLMFHVPKKSCIIDNCNKRYRCSGFCKNHYEQFRRGTLPTPLSS